MRLVIVEDEIRIREGLIRLVQRIGNCHAILGTAESGEDGLELVERSRPDLIITDIKLPGMDGLRMLELLAERGVSYKAVILSAYSEFAYARRAIRLGVSEYLVKPVSFGEFSRSLETVAARLERERRSSEENPKQLRSLENILYAMIFNGMKPDPELRMFLASAYRLDVGGDFAAVEIYPGVEEVRKPLAPIIEACLRNAKVSFRLLSLPRPGESLLVLYAPADIGRTKMFFMRSVIPAVRHAVGPGTVFAWRTFRNLEALQETVESIRRNVAWSITLGAGEMLDLDGPLLTGESVPASYPLDLESRAGASACAGNRKELRECIELFLERLTGSYGSPEDVKGACSRFVLAVFDSLRETGNLSKRAFDLKEMMADIEEAVTKEELLGAVRMLEEFPEAENPVLGMSLTVRRAEQLVRDFYCQGITLNELAAKMDLAPGYLGSLFHRETGLTFNTFLKDCRIRKAKELLMRSDGKLSAIAASVGFSDPKYFSRVFRETTGMLPADFRKLHR